MEGEQRLTPLLTKAFFVKILHGRLNTLLARTPCTK